MTISFRDFLPPVVARRLDTPTPWLHRLLRIGGFSLAVFGVSSMMSCVTQWPFHTAEKPAPSAIAVAPSPALLPEEKVNIGIYQKVSPAVVNISSTVMEMDLFANAVPQEGEGSGIILTPDGYILTNAHVVEDADKLEVMLLSGKTYKARLVGGDVSKDVALLKIDPGATQLPTVEIGDSDHLQVGQAVYAIGNPFGLKSTLTTGVISSLGRTLKAMNGRQIEGVIQTDAAINPGNSGGALLNSAGQLIGINTAIFSPSGGNAGIGFAIPALSAQRIANDLIQHGRLIRPYLGIEVSLELTPEIAQALHLPVNQGLLISRVLPGAPAAKAGLHGASHMLTIGNRQIALGGDIITRFDGQPAEDVEHFINYIEAHHPGDRIKLDLNRQGKPFSVTIPLQEKPQ